MHAEQHDVKSQKHVITGIKVSIDRDLSQHGLSHIFDGSMAPTSFHLDRVC